MNNVTIRRQFIEGVARYASYHLGLGSVVVHLGRFIETEPTTLGFKIPNDRCAKRIWVCIDNIDRITDQWEIGNEKGMYMLAMIADTILHEFMHLKQEMCNYDFGAEQHIDYENRPSEIEARLFARDHVEAAIDSIDNQSYSIDVELWGDLHYVEDCAEEALAV